MAPSSSLHIGNTYRIKTSGKRRSRNCCDGSPRAAPKLHAMAETYALCVEQPIGRLFLALSAALNYVIYGGDARDAVDVHQTRDYIKLSCTSYLRRLLAGHNWETPGEFESKIGSRPTEPIPASCIAALYTTPAGPYEHTQEHAKLEHDMGFAYRSLLGEILYAYVTARVHIGYAINTLAKFAAAPVKIHYQRLKGLALYLRLTIDWGIIYWRSAPRDDLPAVPLDVLTYDPLLPLFPETADHFRLTGYVDAAHANDLRSRRSTTGYAFMLSGGAIA